MRNKNKKPASENIQEEDRLSSLPDDLLLDILSRLRIDTVTSTSVLSRQWHHLWTRTTTLNIHFSSRQFTARTAYTILRQLTSETIHTLDVALHSPSSLPNLFNHVCARNVNIIKVCVDKHDRPISVPSCILQCQSLVELDLNAPRGFKVPYVRSIVLPNLKRISLGLSDDCLDEITRFFESCPLLEDLELSFSFRKDEHKVNISCPLLKSLKIKSSVSAKTKFVVNAPSLMYLLLQDFCSSSYYFVENLPNLVDTTITILGCAANTALMSNLIFGISCVRKLYFLGSEKLISYLASLDDEVLPVFPNLTYLELVEFDAYCAKDLYHSLCCFPNLETLDAYRHITEHETHNTISYLPTNMLSNLKSVMLIYEDVLEVELLEYILSRAPLLEEVFIHITPNALQPKVELWNKFCNTLVRLPRISSACQIDFCGFVIKKSSDNFEDGCPAFEIVCRESPYSRVTGSGLAEVTCHIFEGDPSI